MSKSVTLSDIADRIGVSTVTVSKALSGQKGVSEAVRKQIVDLANQLGYKKSRRIRREPTVPGHYNIGVLIADRYMGKYSSFYVQMYQDVAAYAVDRGSFAIMEPVSDEDEAECTMPVVVSEKKADAIIVIGKLNDRYLSALRKKCGVPVIYMDFSARGLTAEAVISDSFYGSYIMTNYLFDHGHEKIAFVGTLNSTESINDRFLGYVKSLMEHNIRPEKFMVMEDRDCETGKIDEDRFFKLPAKKDMPTAFVCNCDITASTLIHKLRKQGYKVPDDISVVGYDNYIYPGLCDIGITTYEVDTRRMAHEAVHMILHKLEGKPYHGGVQIVEGKLVEKESVRDISKRE
ncbi:MAG: LacI family transcriptional regulator [Lachnospiraceae bacterium]|uniref:LacI family transcriptional regulator n=1 Tax=Candidatus Weimeria bifida TaxID=2599074 RepID=A0A6N7IZH8_9FIRM|nr:LacI family transcriptional regulator [Candidatus Weimeria bifida]RRF95116.1 MAG: LacI family transcriptional regulator [Lachnospiraceae bacterium]